MAIEKKVDNEYGVQFDYHKLREVRVINDDRIGVQVVLTVLSWIDKKARIEGKQPTVRQCIISNAEFAMTPFYALLKAKFEEFSHGVDDFDNEFKNVADGKKAAPAVPNYTVQTAQGQLMRRWSEPSEDKEEKEIPAEETKPEVVKASDIGAVLKKDDDKTEVKEEK